MLVSYLLKVHFLVSVYIFAFWNNFILSIYFPSSSFVYCLYISLFILLLPPLLYVLPSPVHLFLRFPTSSFLLFFTPFSPVLCSLFFSPASLPFLSSLPLTSVFFCLLFFPYPPASSSSFIFSSKPFFSPFFLLPLLHPLSSSTPSPPPPPLFLYHFTSSPPSSPHPSSSSPIPLPPPSPLLLLHLSSSPPSHSSTSIFLSSSLSTSTPSFSPFAYHYHPLPRLLRLHPHYLHN